MVAAKLHNNIVLFWAAYYGKLGAEDGLPLDLLRILACVCWPSSCCFGAPFHS